MALDWIILGFAVLMVGASFLGLIGLTQWPDGPITPAHILLSIISGWVGTRIRSPRKR